MRLVRVREAGLAVLQVNHAHAFAELLKKLDRIVACLCYPITIKFEADEFRVCILQENVPASLRAETSKFIIVIVESEAHSQLLSLLSPVVETRSGLAESIRSA